MRSSIGQSIELIPRGFLVRVQAHPQKFSFYPSELIIQSIHDGFQVRILARAHNLSESNPDRFLFVLVLGLTFLEKFVRIGSIFNKIIERTKDDVF